MDIQMKSYYFGEYIGKLIGEVRHGFGALTFSNGDKYIGEWKNGQKSGNGSYTWFDGNRYVG